VFFPHPGAGERPADYIACRSGGLPWRGAGRPHPTAVRRILFKSGAVCQVQITGRDGSRTMSADIQRINLVGTPCPMNFVLIKRTLDGMPPGESLEVLLDRSPVGLDVAESLSGCGYEVVSIREQGEVTVVVTRKHKGPVQSVSSRPDRRRGCTESRRRR
jgi:TusA-related sulfurtransferase